MDLPKISNVIKTGFSVEPDVVKYQGRPFVYAFNGDQILFFDVERQESSLNGTERLSNLLTEIIKITGKPFTSFGHIPVGNTIMICGGEIDSDYVKSKLEEQRNLEANI